MRLELLELRNFQSYGNNVTTLKLDFNKPVLVLGRNLDSTVDGQIDSNGAGKTTLLNALSYVCYDDTIATIKSEKIKVDDLVNFTNSKNMLVAVEFFNKFYYRVERFRKYKRDKKSSPSNGVYLLKKSDPNEPWNYAPPSEGGHDITSAVPGNINDAIADAIGIPFEIFSRLVIISAANTPFLSLPLGEQRDIVEELFGFTELSKKAEVLKKKISNNDIEIETLRKLDEQITLEITRHKSQLESAKNSSLQWNTENNRKIKQTHDALQTHKETDFVIELAKYSQITTLDDKLRVAQNDLKTAQKDITIANTKIGEVISWNRDHDSEVATLAKKLEQKLLFKSLEEVQEFEALIHKQFTEVRAASLMQIAELQNKTDANKNAINLLKKDATKWQSQAMGIVNEITKLEEENRHLQNSKCPYCSQKFESTQEKIAENNAKHLCKMEDLVAINNAIEKNASDIATHDTFILQFNTDITILTTANRELENAKRELLIDVLGSANVDLKAEYQKITAYQQVVTAHNLKITETNPFLAFASLEGLVERKKALEDVLEMQTTIVTDLQKERTTIINSLIFGEQLSKMRDAQYQQQTWESDLKRLQGESNPHLQSVQSLKDNPPSVRKTKKIQELHETIEHQKFLLKLLTAKDSFIRKALVNRYIPFLNTRIKYYLDKIGLPHRVEFQQDMSVKITQFRTEMKFASASAGQKARINLALSFAFRDVLQSRYGAINFCILDECLDTALGNVGVQLATKMIKGIAKEHNLSMLVISHRDEISSMFDSKMMIELKNGFSNIVESDI